MLCMLLLLLLLIFLGIQLTYRYRYFVGFRDSLPFKAKRNRDDSYKSWLPDFDLARPPQIYFDWKIDYKGNMEGWEF